jgi:hypothetical protein
VPVESGAPARPGPRRMRPTDTAGVQQVTMPQTPGT